jgi:dihydrofolate reductase
MAQTLDGKIAKFHDHFPDWTEKADKKLFVEITKKAEVMILGKTTFDTLPGTLPKRLHIVLSRKASDWDEREKNVIFTSLPPRKILEKLEKLSFENPILVGGRIINTLFARENLIDELIVTISPLVFGHGLGIFDETIQMKLKKKSIEKLGENSLVVIYSVLHK